MKEQKIYDAITCIPDEIIEEAAFPKQKKIRFRKWMIPAAAAVLALVYTLGSVLWPDGATLGMVANAVYLAEYPERVKSPYGTANFEQNYQKWNEERKALALPSDFDTSSLYRFVRNSTLEFLGDNTDENCVYSPINAYMALAMLAEVTDTNSRRQVLEVLGEQSVESLRKNANTLWNNVYMDDGKSAILLANSLWMRDDIKYTKDTLKTLADSYYASSFAGKMGSKKYNSVLRDWMNENTNNMLSDQISDISLDRLTVMAIVSTVYYKDRWRSVFKSSANTVDTFHSVNGDVDATFMNQTVFSGLYYWSDSFSATVKGLNQSKIWFVLPDEGTSPEELLNNDYFWNMVQGKKGVNNKALRLKLSVPKFDISNRFSLIDGLKDMGVTDVFVPGQGDFSALTNDRSAELLEEIVVSGINHGVRFKIDEEGAEGAAYSEVHMSGTSEPPNDDYAELILDRPFVFAVTNSDDIPIFIGIVHNP